MISFDFLWVVVFALINLIDGFNVKRDGYVTSLKVSDLTAKMHRRYHPSAK